MQAGQKSSGSAMVIDSDSAPEDSDFSADEDSSDDGDDSDDSDVVLCAEYRPHVQTRELGDKWEEEAKESKAAQGRPPHSSLGLPCHVHNVHPRDLLKLLRTVYLKVVYGAFLISLPQQGLSCYCLLLKSSWSCPCTAHEVHVFREVPCPKGGAALSTVAQGRFPQCNGIHGSLHSPE